MISSDDYWQVAKHLQDHYELFYTCWHLGKPMFDKDIGTAGVAFDKYDGQYLHFLFDEDWYNELTPYERSFIVAHESLHVVLNHGKRFKGLDPKLCNIAADMVINHMLTTKFGFDRTQFDNETIKGGCFFDTVFSDPDSLNKNQSFEYYYELLRQKQEEQKQGKPSKGEGGEAKLDLKGFDNHDFLGEANIDKLLEILKENAGVELTAKEKEALKKMEHFYGNKEDEVKKAGTSPGDVRSVLEAIYKPKVLWSKIIKSMRSAFRMREVEKDTWIMKHRRHMLLNDNLILPCSRELDTQDYDKLELVAFMDISGSCIHLKQDFYNILNTVPTDLFNITAHTFDTQVREIDLKKTEIRGGGGTCFKAIEDYIRANFKRYPYAVLVITDGWGTQVAPQHADRWHWVLSEQNTSLVPKESKVFYIKDFER